MAKNRSRRRDDDDDRDAVPPVKSDAYVGLLAISLLALLVGCVFMYLDHEELSATKADPPSVQSAADGLNLPADAPKA